MALCESRQSIKAIAKLDHRLLTKQELDIGASQLDRPPLIRQDSACGLSHEDVRVPSATC
jgi:hypothetical protein